MFIMIIFFEIDDLEEVPLHKIHIPLAQHTE